jgi:hypothetical protein
VRRFVLWRSGSPCPSPRFSRKRHATNGSKTATLLPLEWKQDSGCFHFRWKQS